MRPDPDNWEKGPALVFRPPITRVTLEEFTLELATDEGDGDKGDGACRICRIPVCSPFVNDGISMSSPPWDEDEDATGIV